MWNELIPLLKSALPDPIDAPTRVALVLVCGTFAGHSLIMGNRICAPVWLARIALMVATALCTVAAVAGLVGQTVGGLVAALAAQSALCVAYIRIWAGGAWASEKLHQEWKAQQQFFARTHGHLAHIYASKDAATPAVLAEVESLYSDRPTKPAPLKV